VCCGLVCRGLLGGKRKPYNLLGVFPRSTEKAQYSALLLHISFGVFLVTTRNKIKDESKEGKVVESALLCISVALEIISAPNDDVYSGSF